MTDNPLSLDIHEPWAFQPDRCPCDVEFVKWFKRRIKGTAIACSVFHMGPGDHHYVGRHLVDRNDVVTALTLSSGEVDSYMQLVAGSPVLAARYQVLFGDLYQLDPRLLPRFDVGTLFHVGETNTRQPEAHEITQAILNVMSRRALNGGYLLFYTASSAWDRVEPLLDVIADGRLILEETYEHLRIYR